MQVTTEALLTKIGLLSIEVDALRSALAAETQTRRDLEEALRAHREEEAPEVDISEVEFSDEPAE